MVLMVLGFVPLTYFGIRHLEAIGVKRDQAVTLLRSRRALILELVRAAERDPEKPLSEATADMLASMIADINALGESEDGQRDILNRALMAVESARTSPRSEALSAVIPVLDELYVRDQAIVDNYRLQFANVGIKGPRSLLILEIIAAAGLATAAWLVTREFRRRDRVERDLRQSRERLASAEGMAKLGHWEIDWEHKRVELSDALHEIIGVPRKYFGNAIEEALTVVHPEDRARVKESIIDLGENPRPLFDQFRFISGNQVRVMFLRGTPVLDDHRRMVRLFGTAQDITEQIKAEHAIRLSDARFRAICDYAPLVIFQAKPDGQVTYGSPRWEEISGRPVDVALGQGWAEMVHPDDRARVVASWRDATEAGEPFAHEYRLIRVDGQTRWLRVLASPVRADDGEISSYIGTVEDITERLAAEREALASRARFDAVIRASRQVLYDWNTVTNRIDIEGSAEDVLGLSVEELRTLGGWTDQIHPEDRAAFSAQIEHVLRTHEPFSLEYRMRRTDGTYISVHDRGYFVDAPEGKVRMIGLVADLSDRKSLEAQLLQAQKMESLGRLAGGIAHDFNNWLTAIIGHAGIARDAAIKPEVIASLDQILSAADSATGLTRQLVAFARKQVFEPRVCRPSEIVERARTLLDRLIGEQVTLEIHAAPDLWNARLDIAQIQQVLVNLAINARDAMPDGGRLSIDLSNVTIDEDAARLHHELSPGQFVQIVVADTGIGIPPDVLPRIFEPFFTTKEQGKGTGLGLPTVMGIVKQSGGNIWVYSEPGLGTTFKLFFPRADEPAAADTSSIAANAPAPKARPGETILLVEDQQIVRELVASVLTRRGYTVLDAPDAPAALALADQHKGAVNLLLTDLVLPGMDGRKLAAELARRLPGLRVILSSGYTDEHNGLDPGINFIQKPYSPEALARLVRDTLDRPPAPPSSDPPPDPSPAPSAAAPPRPPQAPAPMAP